MLNTLLAPLCAFSLLFALPALALDAKALNINQASAEQLTQLPGIGISKAEAIIKERDAHGPFIDAEDLTRVSGIGQATVTRLAEHLAFEQAPATNGSPSPAASTAK